MSTHNLPIHLARAHAPPRFTTGVLVALSLLAAACSPDSNGLSSPSRFADLAPSFTKSAAASSFTVLANQAVTCTDGTIIGDVGTFQAPPTGKVTRTSCPITGAVHKGDAAAIAAYKAFVATYATYAALALDPGTCDLAHTLTGNLAGVSLPSGTYCVDAVEKTGVLTLTGSGTWTFLVDGALTGTNFTVVMADGGDPCNVTWWVKAASTMTDSHFIGTILAGAAITLTRGTFDGNVYAGAAGVGDVTITGTTVTGCAGGGGGTPKPKCNQGVGNGSEQGCDPGNSNNHNPSNDEPGVTTPAGTPGSPGRKP